MGNCVDSRRFFVTTDLKNPVVVMWLVGVVRTEWSCDLWVWWEKRSDHGACGCGGSCHATHVTGYGCRRSCHGDWLWVRWGVGVVV